DRFAIRFLNRFRFRTRDDVFSIFGRPHRNTMATPQLPRDGPVSNVLHPIEICAFVAVWNELYASLLDHVDGRLSKLLHAHKPLLGQQRLDYRMAAIATRFGYDVILYLLDQPLRCQLFEHSLTSLIAIEAYVSFPGICRHLPMLVDHDDLRQIVSHPGFKIIEVMSGSNLDRPAPKLRPGIIICDQ